jgi:hypothetical protein
MPKDFMGLIEFISELGPSLNGHISLNDRIQMFRIQRNEHREIIEIIEKRNN